MSDQSFNKWFGGSKVVDESGRPLVVYHGTNGNEFSSFNVGPRQQLGATNRIAGAWFTANKGTAHDYAKSIYRKNREGKVIPAYLNIRKPYEVTLREAGDYKKHVDGLTPEKIDELKAAGHDGVFFHHDSDGPFGTKEKMSEIVAFHPHQIKHATENEGSFDPNDTNIYKERGGVIDNAIRIAREHGGRIKLHVGPIHSRVSGRTDHLPVHVPSGAYVLPADIVSAMGEGNSLAGFEHVKRMFGGLPYHGKGNIPYGGGEGPYGSDLPRADGGSASNVGAPVPCVLAGGEFVLSPDQVMSAGEGDMDRGHKALDAFVNQYRAKTIKTLKGLPGPKKD